MIYQVIKKDFGTKQVELKYVQDVDNEIWFRAKTCAEMLDYKNTKQAIRNHIEDDDKAILGDISKGLKIIPLKKNVKNTVMINESGLYSLILGSKKAEAKAFKRWVTKEVLPTIRKTGKYEMVQPVNLLEQKKLEIEYMKVVNASDKLKMEQIEFYKDLSNDDDVKIGSASKDYLMSHLLGVNNIKKDDKFCREFTEICKQEFGFTPNATQKMAIGQLVKKEFVKKYGKGVIKKSDKWVNGCMRPVNCYPKQYEPFICGILRSYGEGLIEEF